MVKISFDVPKEMFAAAQTPEIKAKPYNLCFLCPAHTVTCGGPNEMTMTTEEFVDRADKLAKLRRMTRANIANASELPEATIVSVMTKKTLDPRHSTLQGISKAVNGGCWGSSPCYMASLLLSGQLTIDSTDVSEEDLMARVMELEQQVKDDQLQIEKLEHMTNHIHASYKEEMDAIRAKAEKIADYLKEEIAKRDEMIAKKDRIIERLILKEE